jgi:fumarylacetoacetate (FAA) hydrolase
MRLVTFSLLERPGNVLLGAIIPTGVVNVPLTWEQARQTAGLLAGPAPKTMQELLALGHKGIEGVRGSLDMLKHDPNSNHPPLVNSAENIILRAPIIQPRSIRDFYAFEQHVKTAYDIREQPIPPEWYRFPVFYFGNIGAFYASGETIPYPRGTHELDYELELAVVVGKAGRDILPECAEEHIAGFMIMNDWSARDLQREETRVRLGPAKAKDFATSLGPWLVTLDEVKARAAGRPGVFNLEMIARVNGEERSRGNFSSIHYSLGDILARASQNCTLYPGDVIGTGTVGSGSLLEVTRGKGPYLKPGDEVELEVDCLGTLRNRIGDSLRPGLI